MFNKVFFHDVKCKVVTEIIRRIPKSELKGFQIN